MLAHLHDCLWSLSRSSLKTDSPPCPTPRSPVLRRQTSPTASAHSWHQESVKRTVEEESTSVPSFTIRGASVTSLRVAPVAGLCRPGPVPVICRPGPVPVISRKAPVSWSLSSSMVRVSLPPPASYLTVPSRQGIRRCSHKPVPWFSPLSIPTSMRPVSAGTKPTTLPSQVDMIRSRPSWFPLKLASWNEQQPQKLKPPRPPTCQKRANRSWCRSSVEECCRW